MIQLASTAARKTENAADYFRALFAEQPELLRPGTSQELLACWLRDHPDQTEVPDAVRKNLLKLKKLLRKERQHSHAQSGPMALANPESGTTVAGSTSHKDVRRSDTVHERAGDTVFKKSVQLKRELRGEARYEVRQALVAIPVLLDGSPDWDHRVGGTSIDLSPKGIGLHLHGHADFPTTSLVLLFSAADAGFCCAPMEVRYTLADGPGRLRMGGPFGGFAEDILPAEKLAPTLNPHTLKFSLGISEEVLSKWAGIGVLHEVMRDRVQLCPKCHSLPTFRQACPSCGSADTSNDQLIHHFACAHVGLATDFETDGELVCPKCRTRRLIVGSDYEYVKGPFRCLGCHWSDAELDQVAECLRCGFRFPGHQAFEQELRGYRANRLDPLALLPASGSAAGSLGGATPDGRSTLRAKQDHPVSVGLRA
jgi:hypothetical protein